MSLQNSTAAEERTLFGHPVGLYILFFTELWERFSYYGMRAILVLYMITSATGDNPGLGWENGDALALYGWYTMLVYLMSIPGGILADKYVGQKRAVMLGGLVLVVGHSVLAITAPWAFFTGLALIVIGVGGLKPNISTMVGGLYPPGDDRRDGGFTIFYIGINIGAFLASIVVGVVAKVYGWHYGFGLAGIGMLLGQLVYMWGQKFLEGVGEPPAKSNSNSLMAADKDENTSLGKLFSNLMKSPVHLGITIALIVGLTVMSFFIWDDYQRYAYSALFTFLGIVAGMMMMIYQDINSVEKDRFTVLLISFLIIIVFWGAFEQAGGLLNIYTDTKIDRVVSLTIIDVLLFGAGGLLAIMGILRLRKKQDTGYIFLPIGILLLALYGYFRSSMGDPYEIPTAVFQSVNALFIIMFGTAIAGFWIWWGRSGKENSSLFKMAIGTIIMGVGFLIMAKASSDIEKYGDKAALILLILAYLFHTIGELCASPVALSFITKVAPVKYVSIMMGVYFAATGLGNKVAGAIGEASQAEPIEIGLMNNPVASGMVHDTIYAKGYDFELVGKGYLENGNVVYDGQIAQFVNVDAESVEQLKTYLTEEGATKANPQTVIARYNYDVEEKEKLDAGTAAINPAKYSGQMELFENQNKREFKTYVSIFVLTTVFGLLLLVFLKKLKKLTHGAEDLKQKADDQEAEGYDVAN